MSTLVTSQAPDWSKMIQSDKSLPDFTIVSSISFWISGLVPTIQLIPLLGSSQVHSLRNNPKNLSNPCFFGVF